VRHRIARIHREVHEELYDVPRVDLHVGDGGVEPRHDHHVLAQQPLEHLVRVADGHVQVEHARHEDFLAAEREQLLGERGRSFRGVLDLEEERARVRRHVVLGLQQPRAPHDDGERVVEVVRHAARQLPD